MGTILVEIPHAISRYSDEETRVEIEAKTVGELLDSLWERFPDLKVRVLDREGNLYPYLLLFQNDEKLSESRNRETPPPGRRPPGNRRPRRRRLI